MDNLRRAILLITTVVFVVVAILGFILALDYNRASGSTVNDLNYSGEKYEPSASSTPDKNSSDTLKENILFMVGNGGSGAAEIFTLVNYDSEAKKLNLLYIPCDTEYSVNQGGSPVSGTLLDCSKKFGAEKTTGIVAGLLGVQIDKYVYMDFDVYSQFVNSLSSGSGGVKFNMPVEISGIEQGEQSFDGAKAKLLAMFTKTEDDVYSQEILPYYDGTETGRVKMVASFGRAFVSQKLVGLETPYEADAFFNLMSAIKSKCNTNLGDEELRVISKTIGSFDKNSLGVYRLNCEDNVSGGSARFTNICIQINDGSEQRLSDSKSEELLEGTFLSK